MGATPWVLIHGWGLSRRVWDPIAPGLAETGPVVAVDLPGHGRSPALSGAADLTAWTDAVATVWSGEGILVGWSLGGLIAASLAATRPHRVRGLVLVASTPRFPQGSDWSAGLDAGLLQGFHESLLEDHVATLERFVALQCLGLPGGARQRRQLRATLSAEPAHASALAAGLTLLATTDWRGIEPAVPTWVILGAEDRLVPPTVAEFYRAQPAVHGVRVWPAAGHAPFLSDPDRFVAEVVRFVNRLG